MSGVMECTPCRAACNAGEYIALECSMTSDAECAECPMGQYESGGVCQDCTLACDAGFFISVACSATSNAVCEVCPMGEYELGGVCRPCTVDTSCSVGEFLSGGCSITVNPLCVVCTTKPVHSEFTSNGGSTDACEWVCDEGHFESGVLCVECRVEADCMNGQYLSGTCAHDSNRECADCTGDIPMFSAYSGTGGTSNDCPYLCNPGYTYDVALDVCVLCTAAESCTVGRALAGTCSHSMDSYCIACAEEPANGSQTQGCSWACDIGYHISDDAMSCVRCLILADLGIGEYLSGGVLTQLADERGGVHERPACVGVHFGGWDDERVRVRVQRWAVL